MRVARAGEGHDTAAAERSQRRARRAFTSSGSSDRPASHVYSLRVRSNAPVYGRVFEAAAGEGSDAEEGGGSTSVDGTTITTTIVIIVIIIIIIFIIIIIIITIMTRMTRRYDALPCRDAVAQGFLVPVLVGACVDDAAAAGGANARTNWERPQEEWVRQLQTAGFTVKAVHRDGLQLNSRSARACAAAADGGCRYWWAPAFAIVATGGSSGGEQVKNAGGARV